MSKGSRSRVENKKRFDEEYERIFGDPIVRAQKSIEAEWKINKLRREK